MLSVPTLHGAVRDPIPSAASVRPWFLSSYAAGDRLPPEYCRARDGSTDRKTGSYPPEGCCLLHGIAFGHQARKQQSVGNDDGKVRCLSDDYRLV